MSELIYTQEEYDVYGEQRYYDGNAAGYQSGYDEAMDTAREYTFIDDLNHDYSVDSPTEWLLDSVICHLDHLHYGQLLLLAKAVLERVEEHNAGVI